MVRIVVLGSDHAGFRVKEHVKQFLARHHIPWLDIGTFDERPVDYPLIAEDVARRVIRDRDALGVLVCGTGNGMAITANKISGIRAALVHDAYDAKMAREHNAANILALRGRKTSLASVEKILRAWIAARPSTASRHARRLRQVTLLEKKR